MISLQFNITVVDGGSRQSSMPLTCTFTVTRNDNTPYFVNLPATYEINSTLSVGQVFFTAQGRDNDPPVSFLFDIQM